MADVLQNIQLSSGRLIQVVALVDPTGSALFPAGLFTGLRAMTVQNYVEANVKNGLQFEFGTQAMTVAASANMDVLFVTGSKSVIIKDRAVSFNGAGVTAVVYESPTVSTNGTALFVGNLSRIAPQATTIAAYQGPTITSVGTQISAPNASIGSTAQGQSVVGTFSTGGAERILKSNTSYLLRITNNDTSSCKISAYVTWYEGTPDLPLP